MSFVSNYVLSNRGNFHLQLWRRCKDIAVSAVVSFLLPHRVDCKTARTRLSPLYASSTPTYKK